MSFILGCRGVRPHRQVSILREDYPRVAARRRAHVRAGVRAVLEKEEVLGIVCEAREGHGTVVQVENLGQLSCYLIF